MTRTCLYRILPVLLLCSLFFSPCAHAAEQPEQTAAEKQAANGKTEKPFTFLGVGGDAHIDSTRKRSFEDYTMNMERYCTGCWCNNVFGNNLSESFNELIGKSEAIAALWQSANTCIDPKRNDIAQIRTIPLEPLYDDIDFSKVSFHFSEFLDAPIATRLLVRNPDEYLARLEERFGPPENIDDTWYLWHGPGKLLLFDLFNKRRHDWELGELSVYFTDTLDRHLEMVRQVEEKDR